MVLARRTPGRPKKVTPPTDDEIAVACSVLERLLPRSHSILHTPRLGWHIYRWDVDVRWHALMDDPDLGALLRRWRERRPERRADGNQ